MNEIPGKELASVLERKGFQCIEGGKHEKYYFMRDGKRTPIKVIVSRGNKSYSGTLLNYVSKEMGLTKAKLTEFVQCSMSEADYLEYLLDNKKL
jgi:hypothetical protein